MFVVIMPPYEFEHDVLCTHVLHVCMTAVIMRPCMCVLYSELSTKLQDTLELIEESLDVALSKTCLSFDENHYAKLQSAYKLLAKTQVCPASCDRTLSQQAFSG